MPKFVALSHAVLTARVFSIFLHVTGTPAVRIDGIGLGAAWGFVGVLRILWIGGAVVLTNPADAEQTVLRHRVTAMAIAPILLLRVLAALPDGVGPLPTLQLIEVAGSAMPMPRLAPVQVALPVLNAACREKLAGKAPKYIVQAKGLPWNANGEIVRDVLTHYWTQNQP